MAVRRASQLLRVGVGSAALASIPAMSYNFKVHAADGTSGRMVRITELSLYDSPEDNVEYDFIPEEITPFRQVISDFRQSMWEYLETVQETTDNLKEKFDISKEHTQGLVDYLQNDPGMIPRAAVITVAGLGGIVAGYKGGVLRKVFFSTTAVAAAMSLCYPNEAVALTSEAYNVTLESVMSLWPSENTKEAEGPTVIQDSSPTTADNQKTTVKGSSLKGDLGQSKIEDKDLYTTRSNS